MNPNRKTFAIILAIIGLICITLDAMGCFPNLHLFFNITEAVCYTCFIFFCFEKRKTSN